MNIRNLSFSAGTKLYFKPKKRWIVWGTIMNIISEKEKLIYIMYNRNNSHNNKYFKESRNNVFLWVGQGLLKIKK